MFLTYLAINWCYSSKNKSNNNGTKLYMLEKSTDNVHIKPEVAQKLDLG